MRNKKKVFIGLGSMIIALFSVSLLLVQPIAAQSYPIKPMEIIHGHSPGGAYDLLGRLIAQIGPKYFGQSIVVVSKPGAGGIIAAAEVVNSPPDGHKALIIAQSFFATTIWTQKMAFDPEDLVPVANFMEISRPGLLVRADSPFKTFDDLLTYAKKNPGQLKWCHVGYQIFHTMSTNLLFKKAGITAIDVTFKGTPEALAALLGGHVDVGPFVYGSVAEHLKAGKVRYLLMYSDKRYRDQQHVPTVVEQGYPEASYLTSLTGLYIHRKTPASSMKTLMDVCKKVYDDPEFKPGIEKMGMDPKWGDPEFIKKAISKNAEIGIPILKELGMYVGK